eukprot:COSAG05_NODE_9779_length_602_cov_0.586481_2_plen_66_part_01
MRVSPPEEVPSRLPLPEGHELLPPPAAAARIPLSEGQVTFCSVFTAYHQPYTGKTQQASYSQLRTG